MAKKTKLGSIQINEEWCKNCGICAHFCPKNVLELDVKGKPAVVRLDACVVCRLCERLCPDLAIKLIPEEEVQKSA